MKVISCVANQSLTSPILGIAKLNTREISKMTNSLNIIPAKYSWNTVCVIVGDDFMKIQRINARTICDFMKIQRINARTICDLMFSQHIIFLLCIFCTSILFSCQEATAHMNLGAMLHYNGKLDEAEKSYLAALRLKPNDEITRSNLHKVRNLLGKSKHKKP